MATRKSKKKMNHGASFIWSLSVVTLTVCGVSTTLLLLLLLVIVLPMLVMAADKGSANDCVAVTGEVTVTTAGCVDICGGLY